ncbi:LLM class flavin-dependent oxidoreductase [Nakamurella sp. YIM 132087]|uniref:LLM class flavin-dependent oxidoreductase n=1 Tax=Nakamurella alba TaxID=2665158 RepID=A0A7K1FGB7_9ACTN|nr:LLM class flavin-dependent oxidoreductase [Nakamurella alba]MTD12343.1 LLM class flavin-dependent oxidoreductase [Nakamurella alba]
MQIFGPALGDDAAGDARRAEATGFAGVRVLDHLYCSIDGGPDNTFDHPFVALGVAAAVTERVILTQTVLDVSRRHPVEVAQAISSLDRLSAGRAELGYGTGWYEPEHEAVGIRLGTGKERVDRFIEGLTICRRMLDDGGVVDFEGEHYLAKVTIPWKPTPHPVPIVVGVARPGLLRRSAALADRLEILPPGPIFDDPGSPLDSATIEKYMDTARTVAAAHGRELAFSARVTLTLGRPVAADDPMALGDGPDDVLAKVEGLAAAGFDRLCVLALDPHSQEWLADSIGTLSAIGPVLAGTTS